MEKRREEYEEEDVWGVMMSEKKSEIKTPRSHLSISRKLPSASRMIPPGPHHHHHDHHGDGEMRMHHSSAPVNIPDWSKIYGKSTSLRGLMDDGDVHHDDGDVDDDDDEGRSLALAPHEWLARKMARSQITSFSVCEGAGRTLKGRDLSRVRHAVLSKTGFI